MNKLIRAGIKRLFRIRILYICLAVLFFVGGFDMIKECLFPEPGRSLPEPDAYLLSGFITMVLLAAVLIGSFLGSEHQFGTLRNKLATGHDKRSIYGSSFAVCYTAVMIMYVFVWLTTTVLGKLLLGGYTKSTKELIVLLVISFLGFTMLTALFVLIGLCVQSKSGGCVAALLAAFGIHICGVMTVQLLSVPEYLAAEMIPAQALSEYEQVPEDPAFVYNPDYVGGSRRKGYEILHKLCPVSQMLSASEEIDAESAFLQAAESVVLFAAGMLIFKKRDLK